MKDKQVIYQKDNKTLNFSLCIFSLIHPFSFDITSKTHNQDKYFKRFFVHFFASCIRF